MSESPRNEEAAASIRAARTDAERLIREGVPEAQVLAQLENQLGAIASRMSRQSQKASGQGLDEQVVSLNEHVDQRLTHKGLKLTELVVPLFRPRASELPQPYRHLLVTAAWLVGSGVLLEVTVGRTFVFAAASAYRSALPWLLAGLVPLMACLWFGLNRATQCLTADLPTRWVRGLVLCLLTAVSSLLMIPAPLGWLAAYGAMAGHQVDDLPATLVRVGELRPRAKGCSQTAEVLVMGNEATICLKGVLVGEPPPDGAAVVVAGKLSWAGLSIDKLRPQ